MKKLMSLLGIVSVLILLSAVSAFATWSFDIEGNGTTSIKLNFISDASETFQMDALCLIVNYANGPFTSGANHLLSGMSNFGVIEPSQGTLWTSQGKNIGTSTLNGSSVPLATINFDAQTKATWAINDISFVVRLDGEIWTGAELAAGGHLTYSGADSGNSIPTVSEWGMIIMMLLLVMAGTAMIRRRRTDIRG